MAVFEIGTVKILVTQEHAKEKVVQSHTSDIDNVPNIREVLKSSSNQLDSLNIQEIDEEPTTTLNTNIGIKPVGSVLLD